MDEANTRLLTLLYDDLRSARLSERYYFTRYQKLRKMDLILDSFMVVASIGLLMSGFFLWHLAISSHISTLLAFLICILAASKPITRSSEIQGQSIYLAKFYGRVYASFREIADNISVSHKITAEDEAAIQRVRREMRTLAQDEDASPSPELLRRLQQQVNAEMPPTSFWWPSDERETANSP